MIPLECEFFALRGVALLIETIDKVRDRLNPAIELDGILATMYDPRTLHSREVLERVVEAFGDEVLETVIGRTVKFPDASVAGDARSPSSRPSTRPRRRTCSWRGSWSSVAPSPEAVPVSARAQPARRRRPGAAPPMPPSPDSASRSANFDGPVRPAAHADLEARARHHRGLAGRRDRRVHLLPARARLRRGAGSGVASSSWSRRRCST